MEQILPNSLPADITTEEIMAMDYRYEYTNRELREDWEKLCTILYKNGAQFKPSMKLCQHFFPNFWKMKMQKDFLLRSAGRILN